MAEPTEQLADYLTTARVLAVVQNPHPGANESYVAVLDGGVAVIAKYGGPHPNIEKEAAAWELARILNWTDLVSVTVMADFRPSEAHPSTKSSLQVIWHPSEVGPALDGFPEVDQWRGAVFDAVALHGDRHPGNWLGVPPPTSGQPRLKLIDHGIAWNSTGQPNSQLYALKQGQLLPDELRPDLDAALKRLDASALGRLIGPDATEGVRRRLTFLVQKGTLGVP